MHGKRILIAEDNLGLARVLDFKLRQSGFDVTVCCGGNEAWEALQQQTFDAVVTDFEMPGMNGAELCRRMRQLEQHAEVPVMLVTAREPELDLDQLRAELNLAAIHPKPYSPRQLVAAIQDLMLPALE